jgi:hypothetical protein
MSLFSTYVLENPYLLHIPATNNTKMFKLPGLALRILRKSLEVGALRGFMAAKGDFIGAASTCLSTCRNGGGPQVVVRWVLRWITKWYSKIHQKRSCHDGDGWLIAGKATLSSTDWRNVKMIKRACSVSQCVSCRTTSTYISSSAYSLSQLPHFFKH